MDSRASPSVAGYGVHSSNTIAMSEPSARCTCIARSGSRNTSAPSTGERKRHALFRQLAHRGEAEHLVTAGVGQDRALPVHQPVQAAVRPHDLGPGPQHQVKGVAEDDLRAAGDEFLGRHALDRAVGSYGHERRCLDGAAREVQPGASRAAICREMLELHVAAPRAAIAAGSGVTNIASP